jgi:hypothetical protein
VTALAQLLLRANVRSETLGYGPPCVRVLPNLIHHLACLDAAPPPFFFLKNYSILIPLIFCTLESVAYRKRVWVSRPQINYSSSRDGCYIRKKLDMDTSVPGVNRSFAFYHLLPCGASVSHRHGGRPLAVPKPWLPPAKWSSPDSGHRTPSSDTVARARNH